MLSSMLAGIDISPRKALDEVMDSGQLQIDDSPVGEGNSFFNQQWQTYRRVLAHNYMRHRELAAIAQEFFANRRGQPCSLLDLGCGDGYFTRRAVPEGVLRRYVGVDLSPFALELARTELKAIAADCDFIKADILQACEYLVLHRQKFDLVLSSFCVHHLQTSAKEKLCAVVSKLLAPSGSWLMIDIVRKPGETREHYLERYRGWITRDWKEIRADETVLINEHISSSDFPEDEATLEQLANRAGLSVQRLLVAPEHTEIVLALRPI